MVEKLNFNINIILLADLEFLRWNTQNVNLILPDTKPRNTKTEKRELSKEQKEFNKNLS
jgi:hypothetical protein